LVSHSPSYLHVEKCFSIYEIPRPYF